MIRVRVRVWRRAAGGRGAESKLEKEEGLGESLRKFREGKVASVVQR